MKQTQALVGLSAILLAQSLMAQGGSPPGGGEGGAGDPFGDLQDQLDDLAAQVAAHNAVQDGRIQALEEAGFQTQLDALVSSDAGLQSQLAILFGQPTVVNCPTDTIIAALAAGYTQIEFTGTCAGDIVISARGVMIAGTGATTSDNVVQGNITVRGGIGVDLTNFTVDGNGNPIAEVTVLDGSFIRLTGMDLNAVGLTAQRNSGALVIDSTVLGPSEDQAVEAFRNSIIRMDNTTVTADAGQVALQLDGQAYIIAVNSMFSGGSGSGALRVFQNSSARLRLSTVNGPTEILDRSTVTSLGDPSTRYSGNVQINDDSALIGGNVIGDVNCSGAKSNVVRLFGVSGTTDPNCTVTP